MIKNTKKGSHTIEAAIVLPLVILAILSLGYIMQADARWENCIYCAADECSRLAATGEPASGFTAGIAAENRIMNEANSPDYVNVTGLICSDITSFNLNANVELKLPAGFDRVLSYEGKIKYRCFCGSTYTRKSLGTEGLEAYDEENPVWIFPRSGEKYHSENCTYVKATVTGVILSPDIRKKYTSCGLCSSGEMKSGSVVFVFRSENTAYHRSTCSSIDRHTAVIDKKDAIKRGYTPCGKCGRKE